MYGQRLHVDTGGWMTKPGGISVPLAALDDPSAQANLGIKLALKRPAKTWDYYIQYMSPTDWNQGLPKPTVFIRRVAKLDGADTAAYLGSIEVPANTGVTASMVEPAGNVRFTLSRFGTQGRIVKLDAVAL